MTMKERCLRAMEYHEKGLNCGQSVLLAFADITGFSEEQSMALASGFGGGLRCGGVRGPRRNLPPKGGFRPERRPSRRRFASRATHPRR